MDFLLKEQKSCAVISHFMDQYVEWGDKPQEWVADVKSFNGVEDLLKPGVIEAESKVPGLKAIGIIVDADDQFDSRWSSVRDRCRKIAVDFPEELPSGGLIHHNEHGLRIGVWIMPDNQFHGMLETFLGSLVTPRLSRLGRSPRTVVRASREHGSPYTDSHHDKACIYTFLAWLEPPGRSLNVSVQARAFDSRSPLCDQFVQWFIDLYQLTPRP